MPQWLSSFDQTIFEQHTININDPISRFKKHLEQTQDLDAVLKLVRSYEGDTQNAASYCRHAFEHLLAIGSSLDTLTTFLLEPQINVLAAENYSRVLDHFKNRFGSADVKHKLVRLFLRLDQLSQIGSSERLDIIHKSEAIGLYLGRHLEFTRLCSEIDCIACDQQIDVSVVSKLSATYEAAEDVQISSRAVAQRLQHCLARIVRTSTDTADSKASLCAALTSLCKLGLSDNWTRDIVDYTTDLVSPRKDSNLDTSSPETQALLCVWLDVAYDCHRALLSSLPDSTNLPDWPDIYRSLSNRGVRLQYIASHLSRISLLEFCQIVKQNWLRQWLQSEARNEAPYSPLANRMDALISQLEAHNRVVVQPATSAMYDTDKQLAWIESTYNDRDKMDRQTSAILLSQMLCSIESANLNSAPILRRILRTLCAMNDAAFVVRLIAECRSRALYINPTIVSECIAHFYKSDPLKAMEIYLVSRPLLALSDVPDLPIEVIRAYRKGPYRSAHELWALVTERSPSRGRPLNAAQSQLVHELAYEWAKAKQHRLQESLRWVWWCYGYLRNHNAPLMPLLSKAFVHAVVVKPIEQGKWVTRAQLQSALKVVREIEGDDVADAVDEHAFALSRRRHEEWKRRWRATPGWRRKLTKQTGLIIFKDKQWDEALARRDAAKSRGERPKGPFIRVPRRDNDGNTGLKWANHYPFNYGAKRGRVKWLQWKGLLSRDIDSGMQPSARIGDRDTEAQSGASDLPAAQAVGSERPSSPKEAAAG